jgi:hypothetical protein
MLENVLQNDAPVCPDEAAAPEPANKLGRPRGGRNIDPRTGQPFKQTQARRRLVAKSKRAHDEREREAKAAIRQALAENDFTSTAILSKERAIEILREERGVQPERIDVLYDLALNAARESGLPANEFFWQHGVRKMQESIAAGTPVLLDEIRADDVPGMLDDRATLYATWDYSCSWRKGNPENESFEKYLEMCLAVKDDFFVLNDVCQKDFVKEAYDSWARLMPKLDPRKLRRGYTQKEVQRFLNVSEIKQRLLVASRNSMKSSFMQLWAIQQLLICPDLLILFVTETKELANKIISFVRAYVEVSATGPTRLQQLLPHYMIPESDGKKEEFRCPMAHLKLGASCSRSSMESGGFAGSRNSLCVFDDPLSENTIKTDGAIKNTITKYDAVRKLGEIGALGSILVCTPWAEDDLGAVVQKRNVAAQEDGDDKFLDYRIEPAFVVKDHALATAKNDLLALNEEDVVLRFPRITWKFLRQEMRSGRENNFRDFRSQYLVSWADLGESVLKCTFTDEMLRAATHPLQYYSEQRLPLVDTILSIDTAWSTAATACLSAFAIVKFYKKAEGMIAVVEHMSMNHFRISELGIEAAQLIHNYNPTKVLLERTGPWESVVSEIKKGCIQRSYVIPDHFYAKPTNLGNTPQQKLLRIKVLETMLVPEEGTLFFVQNPLWNDDLFQQFVKFDGIAKNRKVDGPDSISLAIDAYWPKNGKAFVKSEEMKKMEAAAQNAANVQAMHSMIYGNAPLRAPAATDSEPTTSRGPWGIPGIRGDGQAPTGNVGGWGQLHKNKPAA